MTSEGRQHDVRGQPAWRLRVTSSKQNLVPMKSYQISATKSIANTGKKKHTYTYTLKILPSMLEYRGIKKKQEQPSMHCKHISAPRLLESGE